MKIRRIWPYLTSRLFFHPFRGYLYPVVMLHSVHGSNKTLTNTTRTYWSDLRSTETTFKDTSCYCFHTENDSKTKTIRVIFWVTYSYVTPNSLSPNCISLSNSRLVTFLLIDDLPVSKKSKHNSCLILQDHLYHNIPKVLQ